MAVIKGIGCWLAVYGVRHHLICNSVVGLNRFIVRLIPYKLISILKLDGVLILLYTERESRNLFHTTLLLATAKMRSRDKSLGVLRASYRYYCFYTCTTLTMKNN